MIGNLGSIYGMEVHFSEMALKETDVPVREHKQKSWHRKRIYHKRVQKKWIKRWGYAKEPCIWQVGNSIIAHPVYEKEFKSIQSSPHEHHMLMGSPYRSL